jgi:hypothetical protein
MMTGYAFAVVLCAVLIGLLFVLMRRRRLREKYAAIWIVVSAGVLVMAVFPKLAFWLAGVARVTTPVNLLFAIAAAVLLAVCIQLSTEVSSLEEETRTIAEELALLRLEVRAAREVASATPAGMTATGANGPETAPAHAFDAIVTQRPHGGEANVAGAHRAPERAQAAPSGTAATQ